jgi:hypothetical protein
MSMPASPRPTFVKLAIFTNAASTILVSITCSLVHQNPRNVGINSTKIWMHQEFNEDNEDNGSVTPHMLREPKNCGPKNIH